MVSNRESRGLLTVVEILELCWGDVVELGVKALVDPPGDPKGGRQFEVRATAPGSLPPDALGLVESIHGPGHRAVVDLAAQPDRGDGSLRCQTLGVTDREVLLGPLWWTRPDTSRSRRQEGRWSVPLSPASRRIKPGLHGRAPCHASERGDRGGDGVRLVVAIASSLGTPDSGSACWPSPPISWPVIRFRIMNRAII